MATPELAKKKWREKVKGEKWKKGVTGKEDAYCKGVAEFLGTTTCNPDRLNAYREGINRVSAADFDRAVSGKEEKWFQKYKEKMAPR
jgi:predicted oxidoreductase